MYSVVWILKNSQYQNQVLANKVKIRIFTYLQKEEKKGHLKTFYLTIFPCHLLYLYLFDINTYLSVFHLYFEHHSMMKVCLHLVPVSGEVVHLHWSPARVAGEVLGLDAAQPGLEAEAGVR